MVRRLAAKTGKDSAAKDRFLRKCGRVSVVAIKVANKVPKGAKTTPFGNQDPTETPCFISGLRVDVKTAKPFCVGSIPTRASNPFCFIDFRLKSADRNLLALCLLGSLASPAHSGLRVRTAHPVDQCAVRGLVQAAGLG